MDILNGLNDPQKLAVTTTEGPVLILAGAGSGKTKALTHRIAYLINENRVNANNILAVTFTNKAAQEMVGRVNNLLKIENWKMEIAATPLPWMGTFHRICGKILSYELNQSDLSYTSNFSIYDDSDQKQLVKKCLMELEKDPKKNNSAAILDLISGAKNELMTPKDYR